MKILAILSLVLVAGTLVDSLALKGSNNARLTVQAQQAPQQESLSSDSLDESPNPYEFSYNTQSEGSQSSRSESGDATGKVIGQYAIKGADGIQRIVSYTADSEGFRANISTNEPGTESGNPSFIILQSSQLPAAEISRQLQAEADLAQLEEQPAEEQPEQPAKTISSPRKSSAKATRRPVQTPPPTPAPALKPAQVSVPTKSRRPQQSQQVVAAPTKRLTAANPTKGLAIRSRGPSKGAPTTTTTTQRPRQIQAAPAKTRTIQLPQQAPQSQEQPEDLDAQVSLSGLSESPEEAIAEDDSSETL